MKYRAAVSAGFFRPKKVLLIQRGTEPGKHLFTFPGGKVESGESFHEAIVREVKEELNLDPKDYWMHERYFMSSYVNSGKFRYNIKVFVGWIDDWDATSKVICAQDDIIGFEWFSINDIQNMKECTDYKVIPGEQYTLAPGTKKVVNDGYQKAIAWRESMKPSEY